MNKKQIIKTALIWICVPTVLVASYYGAKYAKKKFDEHKLKQKNAKYLEEENEDTTPLD